jgi:hypothetical protein
MPSSKKQKLSKDEKARRKLKSHSSKDPLLAYDNSDWSRAGDGNYHAYGSKKNVKRQVSKNSLNEYYHEKLKKMSL